MHVKPLPSVYHGQLFRSRLEARWAVIFDCMRIPWEYEPDGYPTSAGQYLPDFRIHLRTGPAFFEIKPIPASDHDDPRWAALGELTELPVFVAYGVPKYGGGNDNYDEQIRQASPWWDLDQLIYYCHTCQQSWINYAESNYRVCPCNGIEGGADADRAYQAYDIARAVRFERPLEPGLAAAIRRMRFGLSPAKGA